jgi:cellobiose phosphorylase
LSVAEEPGSYVPAAPLRDQVSDADLADTQHATRDPQFAIRNTQYESAFSADGREYQITLAPDGWTPLPWTNVLANPEFGCLVTESSVGSSWSLNSRENRLTPWSNDPVSDPPADVFYLQDRESGRLWSPTPLPIRGEGAYTVRHGQGYTVYAHTADALDSELTLFVPPDRPVRIARLALHNAGSATRQINVTNYVEWVLGVTRDPSARFVITAWDEAGQALTARNPYNNEFAGRLAFLAPLSALEGVAPRYTADRATFLGRNGRLAGPAALAGPAGALNGHTGAGLDPCAAILLSLTLPPGATVTVAYALGEVAEAGELGPLLADLRAPGAVDAALAATQAAWDALLGTIQVQTPDPALDLLVNRWLLYQALVCRVWARSAFYQGGGAYGFRDQLQDVLALLHTAPALAREQIVRAAGRQFAEGDVQHWWHPPTGRGVRTRFSDDLLWLPFVTAQYLEATGDWGVLDEQQPFLDAPPLRPGQEDAYLHPGTSNETATVYEHCVRALLHGDTQGAHGLPLMGAGDWNDGMNRVGLHGKGESVWDGWFLAATLARWAAVADHRGDGERAAWCRAEVERLRGVMGPAAWDGAWFRRAYMDDGTPLGSAENSECRIDAIAQSWSVLSGIADPAQARQAMAALDEQLVQRDTGLVLLLTPPFDQAPLDPGYIKGYLPGVRENGGQYTHAALWSAWAFAALGDGARAHELFAMINPIRHAAADADRYKAEPYVVVADVYAHPQHVGRGGWTWYTGSAAWMYRLGLEAILGLNPVAGGLWLNPAIPPTWPGFTATVRHGAAVYHLTVDNSSGAGHGIAAITLDGTPLPPDQPVPLAAEAGEHEILVRLGPA